MAGISFASLFLSAAVKSDAAVALLQIAGDLEYENHPGNNRAKAGGHRGTNDIIELPCSPR